VFDNLNVGNHLIVIDDPQFYIVCVVGVNAFGMHCTIVFPMGRECYNVCPT
jgi:hypothetical protein